MPYGPTVHFNINKADSWKEASRFYNAAKRRDWWVTKDGYMVFTNDVTTEQVTSLITKLGLTSEPEID